MEEKSAEKREGEGVERVVSQVAAEEICFAYLNGIVGIKKFFSSLFYFFFSHYFFDKSEHLTKGLMLSHISLSLSFLFVFQNFAFKEVWLLAITFCIFTTLSLVVEAQPIFNLFVYRMSKDITLLSSSLSSVTDEFTRKVPNNLFCIFLSSLTFSFLRQMPSIFISL